jgi:hypothetical protein
MPAERRREVCREYNGWKNYQTWAVNVHGFLDERHDLEELAAEAYSSNEGQDHNHSRADAVYAVANRIREELEELEEYAAGLGLMPLLQDVLGAALEAVDVHTLARHLVDDAPGVPHEATPATAGTK